jgi:hypothetical protein
MSEGMAETTAGHNSKARAGVIRKIMGDLDSVDSRIAELQEERKGIKGRIKADLGMKVADFNVLRRFYQLEDDPRDMLFDVLREGFKALSIGSQSSFLEAIDPKPEPAKGMLPTIEECKDNGALSFRLGKAVDDFPETIKTKARKEAYIEGWEMAKAAKLANEARDAIEADAAAFEEDPEEAVAEA